MEPRDVIAQILVTFGEAELALAQALVGSSTLRRAMRLVIDESETRAALFVPHYWAVYYHDGRGAVFAVPGHKLVFFDDPADDPRLAGGRPERLAGAPRLTRAQFFDGLERNERRAAQGLRPFMYVVDAVGPSAPRPFFDQLAEGASGRMGDVALPLVDEFFQRLVDSDPDVRHERGTARFGL